MILPTKSPLQFHHVADGEVQLDGRSDVLVLQPEIQASPSAFSWMKTLALPTRLEDWDFAARAMGLSRRHLRFVLMDESPLTFAGTPRYQPARLLVSGPPEYYLLTLSHTGYVIGFCQPEALVPADRRKDWAALGIAIPDSAAGECLLCRAVLYDSPLADAAWRAIQTGTFTHACAVVKNFDPANDRQGELAEAALVPGDEAGCAGARILQSWEV